MSVALRHVLAAGLMAGAMAVGCGGSAQAGAICDDTIQEPVNPHFAFAAEWNHPGHAPDIDWSGASGIDTAGLWPSSALGDSFPQSLSHIFDFDAYSSGGGSELALTTYGNVGDIILDLASAFLDGRRGGGIEFGDWFFNWGSGDIAFDSGSAPPWVETASATPHATPEPATLALFGAALIGLGLLRRRRA